MLRRIAVERSDRLDDVWNTFIPDLIVTLIGSALTVAIAAATFLVSRRYRETRAMNMLIQELHHRRALARIGTLIEVEDAERNEDFARVNASVLSIKDAIRDARSLSRTVGKVQEPLSRMTSACNRYLELADRHPNRYRFFLPELRRDIATQVQRLSEANSRIIALEPGTGSLEHPPLPESAPT
jgi:hypothetical protein